MSNMIYFTKGEVPNIPKWQLFEVWI